MDYPSAEDRSSKGRVDETRFFGSRKETEAKENLTYPCLDDSMMG